MTEYEREQLNELYVELESTREALDVERAAHAETRQELSEVRGALTTLIDVTERLNLDYSAMFVDWALLNSASPDYDPGYKPKYPPLVAEANQAVAKAKAVVSGGAQ